MIWLLFISGCALITFALFNIYVDYGSKHWPFVKGHVKHSCVLVRTNKVSSSKYKHFHPSVIFEYVVGNKKYTNNKIGNYLGFDNDEEFANELVSNYPEGDSVKVYYWPIFPKVSLLLPGMKQGVANYILLFAGMVIVLGTFPTLFTDNPYWFIEKIFGFVEHVT